MSKVSLAEAIPLAESGVAKDRAAGASSGFLTLFGYPCLLTLACLLSSEVTRLLFLGPDSLPVITPEAGLFLAALILSPGRRWPAMAAASLCGYVVSQALHGGPVPAILALTLAKALSALSAAALLRYASPRLARLSARLRPAAALGQVDSSAPAVQRFEAFGDGRVLDSIMGVAFLFGASMAGAALGASPSAMVIGGKALSPTVSQLFVSRWTAMTMGMMIAGAFVIAWRTMPSRILAFARSRRSPEPRHWERLAETLAVAAILAAGLYVVSGEAERLPFARYYLVIPFVVWAALRFGTPGAALANLITSLASLIALRGTLIHPSTFKGLKVFAAFDLQSFIAVATITGLFLAAGVSERRRREGELRSALDDKELLLKELEHRVKNNLSVVISVIRMGRSDLGDEAGAKVLLEAETRIRSIALVYEKLYDSRSLARVELGQYVGKLGTQLMQAYAVSDSIRFEVDSEEIELDMKRVVPLGLILNELITNALKYAFPDGRGRVRIELRRSEARISARVSDDGIGLPAGFEAESSGGMGYKLILMLAAQLKGGIKTGRGEDGTGSSTTLEFPA